MKNVLFVLLLIVFSCKTTSQVKSEIVKNKTIFYFIRHAEKESDGTKNPNLSALGIKRANNYVKYFEKIKLNAIYSTNYKRTLNTVNPLIVARNLEPIIYNPFKINHQEFKDKHKNQIVLIAGHSNTTPDFANKMIGNVVYNQMEEDNFSAIYKVTIIDGKVTHELLNME